MRKKVNLDVSETIKKQTEFALQYLEKASPLITYKKLVPVDEKQNYQSHRKHQNPDIEFEPELGDIHRSENRGDGTENTARCKQ